MHSEQASLKHPRVIRSAAYVHVETYKTKMGPRAWEGKLVGYSPDSKAYRMYNPRTRKIVTSRNVTFVETMDAAMPPTGTDEDDAEENASSSSSDVSTSENVGGIEDDFPRETEDMEHKGAWSATRAHHQHEQEAARRTEAAVALEQTGDVCQRRTNKDQVTITGRTGAAAG
ncbi:unnamed protein product [Ectocarpus sp. 4 AP-2014]